MVMQKGSWVGQIMGMRGKRRDAKSGSSAENLKVNILTNDLDGLSFSFFFGWNLRVLVDCLSSRLNLTMVAGAKNCIMTRTSSSATNTRIFFTDTNTTNSIYLQNDLRQRADQHNQKRNHNTKLVTVATTIDCQLYFTTLLSLMNHFPSPLPTRRSPFPTIQMLAIPLT